MADPPNQMIHFFIKYTVCKLIKMFSATNHTLYNLLIGLNYLFTYVTSK